MASDGVLNGFGPPLGTMKSVTHAWVLRHG